MFIKCVQNYRHWIQIVLQTCVPKSKCDFECRHCLPPVYGIQLQIRSHSREPIFWYRSRSVRTYPRSHLQSTHRTKIRGKLFRLKGMHVISYTVRGKFCALLFEIFCPVTHFGMQIPLHFDSLRCLIMLAVYFCHSR